MKKLLIFIISFFSTYLLSAQTPSISQRTSGVVTVLDPNLFTSRSFRVPVFLDTTTANLENTLDSCGKLIYTYTEQAVWYRACPDMVWKQLDGGDSTTYNYDTTLYLHYKNRILRDSFPIAIAYITGDDPIFIYLDTGGVYHVAIDSSVLAISGGTPSISFAVLDSLNEPPLASQGDLYLAGTEPTTGPFVGHSNEIGAYDTLIGNYNWTSPIEGQLLYNANNKMVSKWDGANWIWVTRLDLHQGGEVANYGDVIEGSQADFNVDFIQNNVRRLRIDAATKDLIVAGTSSLTLADGGPSQRLKFHDGNNSIYSDGSSYMNWDAYSGRWRFTSTGAGRVDILFQEFGNCFRNNTSIGTVLRADTSSMLDVVSTTKGVLIPRMTTAQRLAVCSNVLIGTTIPGTGYVNGFYTDHPLDGGSGTGATAHLNITSGTVGSVTLTNGGANYVVGDVLTASNIGGGSGFTFTVTSVGSVGMHVFDTDLGCTFVYDGVNWNNLCGASTLQQTFNTEVGGSVLTKGDTIVGGAHTLRMMFDGITSNSGLLISSTSTAAAGQSQRLLSVDLSGTNATGQDTHAGHFSNSHVDNSGGFNYGLFGTATGSTSANVGVHGQADAATDIGTAGQTVHGTGVYANSTGDGIGLRATSLTGLGASIGSQNGGMGLEVGAYDNLASKHFISSLTNGNVMPVMEITRSNINAGTNGIGGSIDFKTNTSTNSDELSNQLIWFWTDATDATRTSELLIKGVNSGTTQPLLRLKGNGIINISQPPIDYADNAAALLGGLEVGDIYRTGDLLKVVH